MRKSLFIILTTFIFCASSYSQDSTKPKQSDTTDISKLLEEQLQSEEKNTTQYVTATFKTTRLVNGHTVETTAKGVLDVRIDHRFGPVAGRSGGPYNFFGLDDATMRMGFEYGLTNRLMIGIGRSTNEKTYDALLKWKILRQSTGKVKIPVTLDYALTFALQTDSSGLSATDKKAIKQQFSRRFSFTHQLIIGRKFTEGLSLQIMPTVVHRNYPLDGGKNDVWAFGFGGRQKLSKRTSFNAEYYYQLSEYKVPGTYNTFSVGFDIETGGHVFQLHLTNARGMTESLFVPGTTYSWGKGEIRMGFNLSRVFTLGKKHTKEW